MAMEVEIKFRAEGGLWKTMKYKCDMIHINRPPVEVVQLGVSDKAWEPGPDLFVRLEGLEYQPTGRTA